MQSLTTDWKGRAYTLTPQEITDLVNDASASERMAPRYQLLDDELVPIETGITFDRGGRWEDPADLTGLASATSIGNDATQPVSRRLDGFSLKESTLSLNPWRHHIRVFWVYYAPDRTPTIEVPAGTFSLALMSEQLQDSGTIQNGTLLDVASRVGTKGFKNPYTEKAGRFYSMVMTDLLKVGKVSLSNDGSGQTPDGLDDIGPGLPSSRIRIAPSGEILPADIVWMPGPDTKTGAFNQLAESIIYYPLDFDAMGNAVSFPRINLSAGRPASTFTYDSQINPTVYGAYQRDYDNTDIRNSITILAENSTAGTALTASATNTSDDSAVSIQNLGDERHETISIPWAPDQAAVDSLAQVTLEERTRVTEKLTAAVPVNPFHESWDAFTLRYVNPQGIVKVDSPYGFILSGWNIDLTSKIMGLSATKIVFV